MDNDDGEYRVGPGRPPREHQFKKGQSGNPRGRPKGSLNLRTIYLEELAAPVGVKNGDSIPIIRAVARRHIRLAAEGRLAAIDGVLDRAERYQDNSQKCPGELPADDEAILRRFGYIDGAAVSDEELTDEGEGDNEGLLDE